MHRNFSCAIFFLIWISLRMSVFSLSTQFCPPLIAPESTNLTCYYPQDNDNQMLRDCSSSWLPDGTIAYYNCLEELRFRSGEITCKGYVTLANGTAKEDLNNSEYSLPCGIQTSQNSSEFHIYGYVKAPHYPMLMPVKDSDSDNFEDVAIKLVNMFREKHQAPSLKIDELLSKKAQSWADNLASLNSLNLATESFVGQNLFKSDQIDLPLAVNDAIQFWYSEGFANYNWENVKENWDNPLALDFSQLVWKSTKKLGIGAANNNGKSENAFIVAFFYPMGNIVLEDNMEEPEKLFVENVLMEISKNSTENSNE